MQEIDIANFAANLIEQHVSEGKPIQFQAPQAPNAPDVSEVKVPDTFASQVLSEGHWDKARVNVNRKAIKEESHVIQEVPKKIPQPTLLLNEESLYKRHLMNEYKKKVSDLEDLVTEMTTVGMIGVGPGPASTSLSVSKKKKKRKKRANVLPSRYNFRS